MSQNADLLQNEPGLIHGEPCQCHSCMQKRYAGSFMGAAPIAERDTREMLNLIADQLRNGHVSVMAELERRMDELRARQDQDREAISSWISGLQVDLSKFIHLEIVDLRKEVREIDYGSAEWVQTRVLLDLTNKRLKALERKPRKKASKSRK